MKISAISFRGYEPYPINGGKVEKYEYEVKHGMRPCSDTFEPTSSSSEESSCPGSINDLFPDGRFEHNPWFPLDD